MVSARLTNFILNLIGHIRNFVEQRQTLVHPLLDHTQVSHHLENERKKEPYMYFYCSITRLHNSCILVMVINWLFYFKSDVLYKQEKCC